MLVSVDPLGNRNGIDNQLVINKKQMSTRFGTKIKLLLFSDYHRVGQNSKSEG